MAGIAYIPASQKGYAIVPQPMYKKNKNLLQVRNGGWFLQKATSRVSARPLAE
jgi:hypothetical protein